MPDYLLLMHGDGLAKDEDWAPYLERLQEGGFLLGGSAIGPGIALRRSGTPAAMTAQLAGFVRVKADSFDQAKSLLNGNPVYEAGGTVEIRELPRTD